MTVKPNQVYQWKSKAEYDSHPYKFIEAYPFKIKIIGYVQNSKANLILADAITPKNYTGKGPHLTTEAILKDLYVLVAS